MWCLLKRQPERGSCACRISSSQSVEHDNTLDHVGDHRCERPIFEGNSDDATRRVAAEPPKCAIDTDDARRTTEPWRHETQPA